MSKLELLLIGAGVGLVCSLIGSLIGALLSYKLGIKKHIAIKALENKEAEEKRNEELRDLLTDLRAPFNDIKQFTESIERLNHQTGEEELNISLNRLNTDVFILYYDRTDKNILNSPEQIKKVRELSMKFEHMIKMYKSEYLSPFCYFIRALDLLSIASYETSKKLFEKSKNIGEKELPKPSINLYGHFAVADHESVINHIKMMIKDCDRYIYLIKHKLKY